MRSERPCPSAPDLLERIDRCILDLQAIRAAVAGERLGAETEPVVDDLAAGQLLDTTAAQERFGYPQDTICKWCRTEGLGVLQGGRWLVSVPRLQRRINGK